jgi:hypothetical protein
MYDKETFLFFYFLSMLKSNLEFMTMLKKFIKLRKNYVFAILDALLIYYYMILSLQSEYAFRYLEYYMKRSNCSTSFLLPALLKID